MSVCKNGKSQIVDDFSAMQRIVRGLPH